MEEPLCAGSTVYNAPLRKTLVLTDAQCHLSSKAGTEKRKQSNAIATCSPNTQNMTLRVTQVKQVW